MHVPSENHAPLAPLDRFPSPDWPSWLELARAELGLAPDADPLAQLQFRRDGGSAPALAVPREQGAQTFVRPFARGASFAGSWHVLSEWEPAESGLLGERLAQELGGGASGLYLIGDWSAVPETHVVAALDSVDPAHLQGAVFALPNGAMGLARVLATRGAAHVHFGADPLAERARLGTSADRPRLEAELVHAATTAAELGAGARGLVVDASLYHEAGAGPALELGALLAALVHSLECLQAAGADAAGALDRVVLRLAGGPDLMEEGAKLRAARGLLLRLAEHLGVPCTSPYVHGLAARRSHSLRDPSVNLLRSGLSAVAAALGGADGVTTRAMDGIHGRPSPLAVRAARCSQLVLRDEGHLGAVLDPLGGSYALELATLRLAEAGWHVFQSIQAEGGLWHQLDNGDFRRRLAEDQVQRERGLRRLKSRLTGVSVSPAVAEASTTARSSTVPDGALPQVRDALPFEHLAVRAQEATPAPWVLLVAVGPATEQGPRTDFCRNLYGLGALEIVEVHAEAEAAALVAAVAEATAARAGPLVVCLSMANSRFAPDLFDAAGQLAKGGHAVHLAGLPAHLEPELRAQGVVGFPRAGDDAVALLEQLLDAQLGHVGGAR